MELTRLVAMAMIGGVFGLMLAHFAAIIEARVRESQRHLMRVRVWSA